MIRTILAVLLSFSVFSPLASAFERGELLIWINADKGFHGLAEVGRRFEQETGIPVTVETPEDLTTLYDHYGFSAQAPDIIIWPHDRFGSWINEGPRLCFAASRRRKNQEFRPFRHSFLRTWYFTKFNKW